MSTTRRLLVAIGAPLVVLAGLGIMWGYRNAAVVKAQIEAWADSLEHSPNPVTLRLSFLPMYVGGERIGKLDAVVIQRHEPATVDSLRIEIALRDDAEVEELAACQFHLDPDAFDHEGPMGLTQAMQCLSETGDLVRFGTVAFSGTDHETGLFLAPEDLPCEHMPQAKEEACTEIRREIRRLREDVRSEVRMHLRDVRRSKRF